MVHHGSRGKNQRFTGRFTDGSHSSRDRHGTYSQDVQRDGKSWAVMGSETTNNKQARTLGPTQEPVCRDDMIKVIYDNPLGKKKVSTGTRH